MIAFLIHPMIILIPTVIAYASGAVSAIGVGGNSVGYTQILWEFTSAAANNGSDFLGASANTPFFNIATAIVILIGRLCPNRNFVGAFRFNDWQKTRWNNFGSKN